MAAVLGARLSVIRLPKLMLAEISRERLIFWRRLWLPRMMSFRIDADGLEFAEPCRFVFLLPSSTGYRARASCRIERVRPEVAERLRRMNVFGEWLEEKAFARYRAQSMNTLHVCWASSLSDADTIETHWPIRLFSSFPRYIAADDSFTRDPIRTPLPTS